MKQTAISMLSTIKDDIYKISKYLYENPEESFKEFNSCKYLVEKLKQHGFKTTENYYNIPTAFKAEYGSGYPKIALFCEYDAVKKQGHICGHNLISSISIGTALSLTKVLDKLNGTLIVIGCPGEFISSSKVTMAKQGAFDDIDVGLMVHPDVVTCESNSSMAILPLKILFEGNEKISYENLNIFSSLNGLLYTFNSINLLEKCNEHKFHIDKLNIDSGKNPYLHSNTSEAKFYIRTLKMSYGLEIDKKIRTIVNNAKEIFDLNGDVFFYELPYRELITNKNLSRIFCHNLKESGMINIGKPINTVSGLSLGTVSHFIPCIHPYVSIIEKDSNVSYFTKEFADQTITPYAQKVVLRTVQALSSTVIDLIENREILFKVKQEFFSSLNNKKGD